MKTLGSIGIVAVFLLATSVSASASDSSAVTEPVTQYFAKRGGTNLKAILYRPQGWKPRELRPAVVVFHGLDWTSGDPQWGAAYAQHYAAKGLVSICAEYRVAKGSITPLDSMADARDAFRWIRANSAALGIDPSRIAAHGLSTGAHLALSAVMFAGTAGRSAAPNALILYSPAVDLETNQSLQQLLGDAATAASISPLGNVRAGLPPTIIFQGDVDTVTPFASAKLFCSKMVEAGNRCEFNRYMYVGHLFTPKGTPDKTPKPDPRVEAAALVKADAFLTSLGYMK